MPVAAAPTPAPAPAPAPEPEAEPHWIKNARDYNREHGHHAAEFQTATNGITIKDTPERIAAAACKPVAVFPKSSTARRVGREWEVTEEVSSSRHSDANKSRQRWVQNRSR